jgi:hypothetical protein
LLCWISFIQISSRVLEIKEVGVGFQPKRLVGVLMRARGRCWCCEYKNFIKIFDVMRKLG